MAKAPRKYSIADVLGFGAAAPRSVASGLQREYRRMPRNAPIQGAIAAGRPTVSRKLAEAVTPNTRAGNEYAGKIASLLDMLTLTGSEEPLVRARGAAGRGDYGQAAGYGILAALGAIPGGKGGAKAGSTMFDTVRDAGMGQVFRRTPEGAYVTVMENSKYAPRPNSVTNFVVPEELRGKGVGGKMLDEIFSIYGPETISAAASSIPSVKAFYKRGLRPGGNPNATLDDAIKIMKEDSSVTMVKPKNEGIIAYHGSPHSFDKFALDKIGSGEGAQAYGHGLYFAEAEDVAKRYRDNLSGRVNSKANRLLAQNFDIDAAILTAKNEIDRLKSLPNKGGDENRLNSLIKIQDDAIKELEARKLGGGVGKGSMYQVRINANPEDFIDWDALLSEQSPRVKQVFGESDILAAADRLSLAARNPMFAGDLIKSDKATPAELSQALSSMGIPGIKYKDAASRGTENVTRNYVVFDDALIDILKKYGIAIPALAGGGLLATQPQQNGGI